MGIPEPQPQLAPVLAARVEAHAARDPESSALRTLAETWTWSELAHAARRVAGALTDAGIEPGDFVVVGTGTRPEFAAAYCGVELAGAVPVLLDTKGRDWQRQMATVAVAAVADAPRDPASEVRIERLERLERLARSDATRSIAHVLFTSGTTGSPKGVVWSKQRFARDLAARRRSYGPCPCLGLWSPLDHSMGFRRLATSLYYGVPLGFIGGSFAIPQAFADMAALGVTHVYCTPMHVELMLRTALPPPPALRTLDTSAGRVAPASLLALAEQLVGVRVSCSYGTSEVGTVTILAAPQVRTKAHSVGVAAAHSTIPINNGSVVSVVDDAGQAVAAGVHGEVVVTVADWTAVDGYFRPDGALAARFADGVLRTGDRGWLDEDGFLCLEGRNDELLKVAGHRVATPALEERLRALYASGEVCVVGVAAPLLGQVPVAFYEPTAATPGSSALDRLGRAHLSRYELPRWAFAVRALPRTSLGKIQRASLQQAAERWIARWPSTVPVGARLWPSAEMRAATTGARAVMCLDGVPPVWRSGLTLPCITPLDRELCFATSEPVRELVAWAAVGDALAPNGECLRVVSGPLFAAAHAHDERLVGAVAGWLSKLAVDLPGTRPVALAAQPSPALRPAFRDAGWTEAPGCSSGLLLRLDDSSPSGALWPPSCWAPVELSSPAQ